VADNCTDRTAERAADAGAQVMLRKDAERRGKGYALTHAFAQSRADGFARAVVVVDADTVPSPNLLQAFAARLEAGAMAIQADYAIANPRESWRTRLMSLAFSLFHGVRSLGRERLGLSCGLRGNGMCFSASLLTLVPHDAFSIVEDLEYGIRLGQAGYRVMYAPEAHVYGEMVSSERASRSQRRRWEGGRLRLARLRAAPLLRQAVAQRSPILLDLAMDLFVPPLSWVGVACAAGLLASAALAFAVPSAGAPAASALAVWSLATLFLFVHGMRGWALSGVGLRGLLDLFCIPVYVAWKVTLLFRRPAESKDSWVRTARSGETR
jgi:cellulose synthase/poly-beta-1,6-N-acetylglucosamine synthase-like glycosyltransferase